MTSRRHFVMRIIPAAAALLGGPRLTAAQPARLEESDPVAVSLGYRHDASKVDAKKYPRYAAGQICGNCRLYTGKPGEQWGPCSAVGGKLVNVKGWCAAWIAQG